MRALGEMVMPMSATGTIEVDSEGLHGLFRILERHLHLSAELAEQLDSPACR